MGTDYKDEFIEVKIPIKRLNELLRRIEVLEGEVTHIRRQSGNYLKANAVDVMKGKDTYENITMEELPEILTAKHISGHLHLSLRRVYELLQISPTVGGIKSFDIGRSKRVVKDDYLKWLTKKQKGENL